jgi:cell wall-associated NlpC family hydrolase
MSVSVVLAALTAACATTGAVPHPFPVPGPSASRQTHDAAAVDLDALVSTALALRGTPYQNGGAGPTGFDCSGFTQYVYFQHGVALPRDTQDQFREGVRVNVDDLVPGDLLFFTTSSRGPSHVAIAIGNGQFVHAPSSRGVVRVERLDTSYWSSRYLGARRITGRRS